MRLLSYLNTASVFLSNKAFDEIIDCSYLSFTAVYTKPCNSLRYILFERLNCQTTSVFASQFLFEIDGTKPVFYFSSKSQVLSAFATQILFSNKGVLLNSSKLCRIVDFDINSIVY